MSDPPAWSWFRHNILCFPFKWYIDRQMKKPSRHAHVQRPDTPRTAPLPSLIRAHQLSITAEDLEGGFGKRTEEQLHSSFLGLPLEIRLQIYKHALGGKLLHLGLLYNGNDLKTASLPHRLTCKYGDTHPSTPSTWTDCFTLLGHLQNNLLPLLITCRRIYTEALPLLYKTNIFDFRDPYCLQLFLPLILPQRLASIRSVRFYYAMPRLRNEYIEEIYEEPWQALLSMTGLRDLRVKFSAPKFPESAEFWTRDQGRLLAPLKHFKGLQLFEVYLPLMRTMPLPKGVDVGCCQLFAVDASGKPYRDYDVED